jgi:GTPase SAR1 family protein
LLSTDPNHKYPQVSNTVTLGLILSQAIPTAREFTWSLPFADSLAEIQERLQLGRFRLAVLGQFKRGKSTLLNALLGGEFLPSSILPLTSIPVHIEYGPTSSVVLAFLDGTTQLAELDELGEYVTEQKNPNNEKFVSQVRVLLPSVFLQNNFVLIDTPGIGSTFTHNTDTTRELIPKCDAAIFLLSVDPPVSEAELEFLKTIRGQVKQILFALNKTDYVRAEESEQIKSFFQKVVCEKWNLPSPPPVFLISAKLGLESCFSSDTSLWATSGMQALKEEIQRVSAHMKSGGLCDVLALKISNILAQWERSISVAMTSLDMPLDTLDRCLRRLEAEFSGFDRKQIEALDVFDADVRRTLRRIEEESEALKTRLNPFLFDWLSSDGLEIAEKDSGKFQKKLSENIRILFKEASLTFLSEISRSLETLFASHEKNFLKSLEGVQNVASREFQLPPSSHEENRLLKPEKIDVAWETRVWLDTILMPSAATIERFLPTPLRRRRRERRLQAELSQLITQNTENLRWKAIQEVEIKGLRFREGFQKRYDALKLGTLTLVRDLSDQRRSQETQTLPLRGELGKLMEKLRVWKEALHSFEEKKQ